MVFCIWQSGNITSSLNPVWPAGLGFLDLMRQCVTVLGQLSPERHCTDNRLKQIPVLLWNRPIFLPWNLSLKVRLLVWYITNDFLSCSQETEAGGHHSDILSLPHSSWLVSPRKKLIPTVWCFSLYVCYLGSSLDHLALMASRVYIPLGLKGLS